MSLLADENRASSTTAASEFLSEGLRIPSGDLENEIQNGRFRRTLPAKNSRHLQFLLATDDRRVVTLIPYRPMSLERIVSMFSLLWFFGGALWLLIAPVGFVRFASLGTRPSLTPAQLKKARIIGCLALVIGAVIVLEFVYGFIR